MKTRKENKRDKLELVHTDVWVTYQAYSLCGFHYYVTFIDDATKKYGFISLDRYLMYLKILRNGNAWLKMRLVKT